MSYIVFARKWRPQDFDDVVGQDHIIELLKNSILKNRLAHAFLFAGPRGVGKTSTARILAKSLNCEKGTSVHPCNKCSCCKEISEGRSLDVIEIDGASNRGIDEIRTLRENVKFSPVSGKFKIYIIDEVHMLTTEAFNALLKTLEEPPDFVKFIFATTQPQKVIPTILSRCQRFDFYRITALKIVQQLEHICKKEKIANIGKDVLFAIAKASDGSMRDAESVLDQLISFSSDKIDLKDIISLLGIVEQEALFKITERIIKKDAKGILDDLEDMFKEGKDSTNLINNLIEHFRNLMIVKINRDHKTELIDLPEEACSRLYQQSEQFSLQEILRSFTILTEALEASKRVSMFRIPLEIALVKLVQLKAKDEEPVHVIKQNIPVKGKIELVKNTSEFHQKNPNEKIEEKPVVDIINIPEKKDEETQKKEVINENSINLDRIKEIWPRLLEKMSQVKVYVSHCLQEALPLNIKSNVLTLGFFKQFKFHKETLESKSNCNIVESVLSELAKEKIRLKFELLNQNAPEEITDDAKDSVIKSAIKAFNGRIVL